MEKAIKKDIVRIAIVGPESTGKTTLAIELAKHYNTLFVPEYAREYINLLKRPYTIDDIVAISKGQIRAEDETATKVDDLLICDTNLVVTKIWAEYKYGYCPEWILNTLTMRNYDLHLLCNIDIPWQPDPQREHPTQREEIFNKYQKELIALKRDFVIISGLQNNRTENAINAIDDFIKKSTARI